MTVGVALRAESGPQSTTLRESSLSATAGLIAAQGAAATLRDVRISAESTGAWASLDSLVRMSNVLVTTSGPGATGIGTGDGNLAANHVTVVNTAAESDTNGVEMYGGSVALQNSIVHGYAVPILRNPLASGSAHLTVRYTNVDLAASILNEDTVVGVVNLGQGIQNQDPRFAAPGDFHLRGDSKLIDAGELTSLAFESDIEGLDRDKDGDGDQLGEVDLGAFEYQRGQPVADFSYGPAAAGTPVAFDASPSSDPDPGDESGFAYEWSFGDGSSASGRTPQHAYAQAGDYPVSLTVTDPSGQTAATTRVVSVAAAAAGGADGGTGATAGSGPTGADVVAPVIFGLRVSPRRLRLGSALARLAARGGQIRFRLSEPALVTLRFDSSPSGRRKGVLRLKARAGLNTVRFAGRLARRRALRPGAYRLTVLAKDAAGNAASTKRARFALLRKR
jgi:hypothetical protein